MKALVTGAAGFIGSHLVDQVIRMGAGVVAVDNLSSGSWTNLSRVQGNMEKVEGDVRDVAFIGRLMKRVKPDSVFHLAGSASVPRSVEEPLYDFENNCLGTVNVLEAVRVNVPRARVVFSSSGAVYGEPGLKKIDEALLPNPISPYGASKVAAETECMLYNRVYGVDVVIARVFNTYGQRMTRFAALDFLKKLRQDPEHLEVMGNGDQVRDFNYVADTVRGLLVLESKGVAGKLYNLASGESRSVRDLAVILLRVLGREKCVAMTFTGSSWPGDAQYWDVDISRIKLLGYEPGVRMEQGLSQLVEWFNQEVQ